MGQPISDKEIISYLNYYEKNKDYYFFRERSTDALVNICYFTKIMSKVSYTTPIKNELCNYIRSIQYTEGDFALSKRELQNEQNSERHPELNLLSTKMAIESLAAFGEDIPNMDSIADWLELRYNNLASGLEKRSAGNIILLRDISKLIDYDYSEYEQLTNDIAKECKEAVISSERPSLSNVENLLYGFNDKSILEDNEISNKIKIYVLSLQDTLNGHSNLILDKKNILSAYYSLQIIKDLNISIDNTEDIVIWIKTFKTRNGGFILTGELPNDLSSTYYAYKLGLMQNEDAENYINTLSDDFENYSMELLYMYKALVEDLNLDKDTSKIEEIANKKIEEFDASSVQYLEEVLYASKILDSENITSKIIKNLNFDFDDYIRVNVNNQIFLALLYEDSSKELSDKQIEYFENIFQNTKNQYDLYSLDTYCIIYQILSRNTNVDKTIDEQIQQILNMCLSESEGVYRNGTSENSYKSLRSSYLASLNYTET